jgi:hypothetical protein
VAPEGAGSSPVGHPLAFPIGKGNWWKASGSTERDRRASAPVSLRGCSRASSGRCRSLLIRVCCLRRIARCPRRLARQRPCGLEQQGCVAGHGMALALPEHFFRRFKFGEVDHRDHLDLVPVVGDDRCLSSVGEMMPSFRSPMLRKPVGSMCRFQILPPCP